MAALESSLSIFFSGVPTGTTEVDLRALFERAGKVVNLRINGPRRERGDESLVGFVDFADQLSAKAALNGLAGYKFSDTHALAMKPAEARKPKRERDADLSKEALEEIEAAKPFVEGSSVAARGGDPVQAALNRLPLAMLYEAVEQLRVLALERPGAAEQLLNEHPQLRYAATLILQHAGRLPMALPAEATSDAQAEAAAAAAAAASEPAPPSAGGGMADAMAAMSELSEEELQHILQLTDEELAQLDPAERAHLTSLKTQLLGMLGGAA